MIDSVIVKAVGTKSMCRICGEKPVMSKQKGVWRSKYWRCNNPNRLYNASERRRRRKKILTDCVRCGATENIEIDHKDGDRHNNSLDNLQCLCTDCHKLKTIENKEYLPLEKRKIEMSA